MTAPALPPAVVSGELITSSWGNAVVNSLKLVNQSRPYLRFLTANTLVGPSVVTGLPAGTGATNVTDPFGMLAPSNILLPAAWTGLWAWSAVFQVGSHSGAAEVKGWIQDAGGTQRSIVQVVANATKGQFVAMSSIFPANGGTTLQMLALNLNPSNVTVAMFVELAWLGHSV